MGRAARADGGQGEKEKEKENRADHLGGGRGGTRASERRDDGASVFSYSCEGRLPCPAGEGERCGE